MIRDADQIADDVLPLDGPYNPDSMALTARLLPELVRRLNHATMSHNADESLPYPQDIDRLAAGLVVTVGCLMQLTDQLASRLGLFATDSRLRVDGYGKKLTPPDTAEMARHHLTDTALRLSATYDSLLATQSYTARLAWNDGDDD